MDDLHLLENSRSIISDSHIPRLSLNLNTAKNIHYNIKVNPFLTILSIPLGPRLVLIASATAGKDTVIHP